MALLTDQILATGVTGDDLIHVVITGDTSQNPAGSSFKATISQVLSLVTGGTPSGDYLPLSGGTVTGNTFFGITSGITLDQVNDRIGIGTPTPQNTLELYGSNSLMIYGESGGGYVQISGNTDLPRFQATSAPSGSEPAFSIQMGVRNYNNVSNPGYGVTGDTFIYASNEANGLNIINRQGTGTEDYIRFYAGQDANGTIADVTIVGSGSTRGYVGFGTENPTEKLDINGNAIIQNGLTASTLNISSTPTTDVNLSANYLTRDGSTGEVKVKTIPGPTVFGLYAQTGNSVVVSATTTESTLIGGGIGSLSVPANGFQVGDSFRVVMGGVISAGNNEDIRIRVKSGSVVLSDSLMQNLGGGTNDVWVLQIDFTIRTTGTTGVASIVTLGVFTTHKTSNSTSTGFSFNTVNNTTFDTTSSNTLDITVEWDTNSGSNSIYSDIFVLNKVF